MKILDHIDNIQLNDDFPIKNLHALNYHTEGIYYLAKTVRDYEINFYQLNKGSTSIQMIGLENQNILMNMFNWFSISLINYIRLVGFIDYVTKYKLDEKDIVKKEIKKEIKKYSNDYVKKIIPEIVQYRNKLSAHHSLFDPFHDDTLATLLSSSLNTIVYRSPYYEASMYIHTSDNRADLKPWILTKTYEDLCARYWPEISLPDIPVNIKMTDLYKGYEAERDNRDADALVYYLKTINHNINSKDLHVQMQVASAMIQYALILQKGLNPKDAINEYKKLIHKFGNVDNIDVQRKVAMAIYNIAQVSSEMKNYTQSISYTNQYFEKFHESTDLEILTGLGDLMIGKGIRLSFLKKIDDVIKAYDDTINFFKSFSEPDLYIYEAQAYVNKTKQLKDLGLKNDAMKTRNLMLDKYEKSTSSKIQDQVTKIRFIML